MGNIANVKIGACVVTFGGTDLGHTKGGADFTYETDKAEITVDETGSTIRDFSLIGEKAMIKVRLAESSLLNLSKIMPMAELQATNTRLQFGKKAGQRFLTEAAELVLRPLGNVDDTEDLVLYKAVVVSEVPVSYNNEDERVIEVEFQAMWDATNSALGHFGVDIA